MSEFARWDGFYGIVGSAAGALIGLQFVVMTLIVQRPPPGTAEVGTAFASPTIVHFSLVLLLSALAHAPWDTIAPAAWLCSAIGFVGALYVLITARRMRAQTAYKPVFEDWLFHCLLPLAAYATLAASGIAALANAREAGFAIAAATLVLLFSGIHNAWDATAYHVLVSRRRLDEDKAG